MEIEKTKKGFLDELQKVSSEEKLAKLKSRYLGNKGAITNLVKKIKDLAAEDRPQYGKDLNALKKLVQQKLAVKEKHLELQLQATQLEKNSIDLTAPFDINTHTKDRPHRLEASGTVHPISQAAKKALGIFEKMGFEVVESRVLDNDENTFEYVNIPKGHPARDMWDSFRTEEGFLPTPHTSCMQNRIYKSRQPPIRSVILGRCFRSEATDARHEHTFYQIEGVYVDKDITISNMIATLYEFLSQYYYPKKVNMRIQPTFFPFVEPGIEVMIECSNCQGKGCKTCSGSGWLEVMPAGMIHPNVLRAGGLDPKEYSGFAWAVGHDRLTMIEQKIEDIRWFHSGDLRFLEQF